MSETLFRDPSWPEGFFWSEAEGRPVYSVLNSREAARPYFESIHGEIYLWRIGEVTAERALEAIDEWMSSVETKEEARNYG